MIPNATVTKQYRFGDLAELYRSSSVTGTSYLTIENGVLYFNRQSVNDNCHAYWPVYAPAGAIVEVSFEARNSNTSSQGSVSFEVYSSAPTTIGNGTPIEKFDLEDSTWKTYSLTWDGSETKPFMGVVIGLRDSIGAAYFRNIIITVYNTNNYSPEFRGCMVKYDKAANSWIIDDAPGRFSNTGVTDIRAVGQDYLELTYSPLESWQRPLGNAHMEYNAGTAKYYAKLSSTQRNKCWMHILNVDTGAAVQLNSLPNDAYVAVTLFSQ
ncbi:hypothetical protein HMPREF3291_05315 [Bacillus sp. HMSC76G11]|nr:hypothetical protein HMPREF3291_05315 [Bacillus sp. HMSC76G11]